MIPVLEGNDSRRVEIEEVGVLAEHHRRMMNTLQDHSKYMLADAVAVDDDDDVDVDAVLDDAMLAAPCCRRRRRCCSARQLEEDLLFSCDSPCVDVPDSNDPYCECDVTLSQSDGIRGWNVDIDLLFCCHWYFVKRLLE